jgi:outer membrane protein OmpA-like peptidoglycan-associated protein
MTYVLWGITPEGRPANLGEVALEGDHAKLLSTTDLQTFGLIVTAEPYFAVTQPSDVVVAENFLRSDTSGTIEQVDAKYELLQRGQYVLSRGQYQAVKANPKGPLQLGEAENAVEIARISGAEKYAGDTFQKAVVDLRNAEEFLGSGKRKESETDAREAAQMAEDARIITFRAMQQEELANEQERARRAAAQAQLDLERRKSAEADSRAAQQAKAQAEQAKAQAEQAQAQAEQAKLAAQQEAEQAQRDKAAADAAREAAVSQKQTAEAEQTQLRERLRQQLNMILETRETARGLIVDINDVLFDFNKFTLKPGAREKLAKVAGILLAYPGLRVQLEGHTDSIGSDEYNVKLSEERAGAVRDYLSSQGVSSANLSATGLGKENPVASNDTETGRQQNRRVDLVVSGAEIGMSGQP